MADWTDRDALVNYIRWQWLQAGVSCGRADVHWSDAWVEMYQGGSYDVAQQHMLDCMSDILLAVKQLLSPKSGEYPLNAVPHYLWHFTGAELDMDSLLSTMLSADPDQVEYFVGLLEAYRQSVWNRPFNEEFFAALARGFMIWP